MKYLVACSSFFYLIKQLTEPHDGKSLDLYLWNVVSTDPSNSTFELCHWRFCWFGLKIKSVSNGWESPAVCERPWYFLLWNNFWLRCAFILLSESALCCLYLEVCEHPLTYVFAVGVNTAGVEGWSITSPWQPALITANYRKSRGTASVRGERRKNYSN